MITNTNSNFYTASIIILMYWYYNIVEFDNLSITIFLREIL